MFSFANLIMKTITIKLKQGKEKSLQRKHPWVFSGAILQADGEAKNGDIVAVVDSANELLGYGHYQIGSITVRMITFNKEEIDQQFWNKKINAAWDLRKQLGLTESKDTNVFRLIHGEGDGLPGLIIDFYNGNFVIQCHTHGMYKNRSEIALALQSIPGLKVNSIYDKSQETMSKDGIAESGNSYLFGNHSGEELVVENGNKFLVNWETGQKTGFFIDQRDNRNLLSTYIKNKSVLNTFCYSGGFSVYALNNGAKLVHSLDSSAKAIELVEKNIALLENKGNHLSICNDAIPYLRNMKEDYDVIILDPPAYAKHLSAKRNALQGYRRLNEEALLKIKPGGILFTFSCSQAVDMTTFTSIIFSAAINAKREIKILHRLHQPADHPISIFHPEGEYLKGLVLFVL